MLFDDFTTAQVALLATVMALALVFGAVASKTHFCTMGAVSDWVNIGHLGRLRAWLLAIATALLGVALLEYFGLINLADTFPPYRNGQLIWAENLLGGLLFGVGMTLASGCGNKTLVRIGGGNLKSLVVLLVISVIAYYMVRPLPDTDQTLYSLLFYDWLRPLAISTAGQDLGTLLNPDAAPVTRTVIGVLLSVAILVFVFRSAEFRASIDNILGGLTVGLVVLGAWYVTSAIHLSIDGETYSLTGYVEQWDFLAESAAGRPADSRALAVQSFTFINPLGQTLGYVAGGFDRALLTFGIVAVFGVIGGSLLWSLWSRSLRLEWFASWQDFFTHVAGAVLMGFGGVLALGCTIGQGISGVSTLALGSFLALFAMVFGSALTMKVRYYRMVYEAQAGFVAALLSSLVDMKLLPGKCRRLERV